MRRKFWPFADLLHGREKSSKSVESWSPVTISYGPLGLMVGQGCPSHCNDAIGVGVSRTTRYKGPLSRFTGMPEAMREVPVFVAIEMENSNCRAVVGDVVSLNDAGRVRRRRITALFLSTAVSGGPRYGGVAG